MDGQCIHHGGIHKVGIQCQRFQQQPLLKQDVPVAHGDKLSFFDHLFQRSVFPYLQLERPDTFGVGAVEQVGGFNRVQVAVGLAAQTEDDGDKVSDLCPVEHLEGLQHLKGGDTLVHPQQDRVAARFHTDVQVAQSHLMQLPQLLQIWEKKLEPVFPCRIKTTTEKPPVYSYNNPVHQFSTIKTARPNVLIPVFPGTNCEYDTARIFERAGARAEVFVIRNLSASAIAESVEAFTDRIKNAQIIMIPGGFSGGDEPEGSGKFITAFFRNPKIMDAVHNLLQNRDGLMLGICNGFQALIKLGLVPFGKIVEMEQDAPTLTFNTIARHQSMLVTTRVASTKSPWLYGCEVGDLHTVAISHGEGRFVAPPALIEQLAENGQIATQYVDLDGNPTMDIHYNPNTSMMAIEGITSPDGRVFGKMGHSERIGTNLYRNVPGEKDQKIFQSGVAYFR